MLCSFFSSRFFSRTANLSSGVDVVHTTRQVCGGKMCNLEYKPCTVGVSECCRWILLRTRPVTSCRQNTWNTDGWRRRRDSVSRGTSKGVASWTLGPRKGAFTCIIVSRENVSVWQVFLTWFNLNLTEFNWIAAPSPIYVGNPGWHRTRKPMAYRVSCYTHSQHLNMPRSFKIVVTSSINTFPWQSIPFIYRSLKKFILSYA